MILATHQPQYLPWIGYFDKLDRANVFVLLDNVQYKKNGKNKICYYDGRHIVKYKEAAVRQSQQSA